MNHYKKGARYFPPAVWIFAAGGFLLLYSIFLHLMTHLNHSDVFGLNLYLGKANAISMAVATVLLTLSLALHITGGVEKQIEHCIKKRLYDSRYGNPLGFREGELLPPVRCRRINRTTFEVSVRAGSCTVEDLLKIAPVISSSMNGRYKQYAVVSCEADEAFNWVAYRIEDVLADKSLTVDSVEGLKSPDKTKIPIDTETFIDLKTSGSILVAGKTRSGKTTGTNAILTSLLQHGRDGYDSNIFIIDPKLAELSMLPHVVTINPNGDVEPVIAVMKEFESTRKTRQAVLNRLSQKTGNAVKWWDAGMHPSILFIDEYVALKSLFPKSAKGNGGFNISDFEGLLKRIITMGASAGCFVIISIAEASVEEGGLPSMLKSAMTTKILFKPTVEEARLIWNSERLKTFNAGRAYGAGDCLFSSTDGMHDTPGYLHFPNMEFEVYAELGRLLTEYYAPKE
ncbi:MAG: hypothetical protein HFF17_13085 [Oscillospiraceae bacterium]|nr:hypothetical protein [Oscillospiraceae bacterium]